MSLSSLKEIHLDYSWIRELYDRATPLFFRATQLFDRVNYLFWYVFYSFYIIEPSLSEKTTFQNLLTSLELDILPKNSWILDMTHDDGDFIKFCAKKHPYLNFVFFKKFNNETQEEYDTDVSTFPENVTVFYMPTESFIKNNNQNYEEFLINNKVGYRRVVSRDIKHREVFERIDKSLYKDYGNTIKSFLLVYGANSDCCDNNYLKCVSNGTLGYESNMLVPLKKQAQMATYLRTKTFYPVNDFNNN
jgi:hypothetical protein